MSLDHLDTAGVDCRRVFMWSGGSAAQYKWTSRKFCRSFYVCRSWQHRTKLLRFRTWKRRGRWRGWLRHQGDGEDTSRQMVIINVVSDWYQFCLKGLISDKANSKRTFVLVGTDDIVCHHPATGVSVTGSRKMHQVARVDSHKIKMLSTHAQHSCVWRWGMTPRNAGAPTHGASIAWANVPWQWIPHKRMCLMHKMLLDFAASLSNM